jgi:hypothetical protein
MDLKSNRYYQDYDVDRIFFAIDHERNVYTYDIRNPDACAWKIVKDVRHRKYCLDTMFHQTDSIPVTQEHMHSKNIPLLGDDEVEEWESSLTEKELSELYLKHGGVPCKEDYYDCEGTPVIKKEYMDGMRTYIAYSSSGAYAYDSLAWFTRGIKVSKERYDILVQLCDTESELRKIRAKNRLYRSDKDRINQLEEFIKKHQDRP